MSRLLIDTRGMNAQQAGKLVEHLQKVPQVQVLVLGDDTVPYTREVDLVLAASRPERGEIQRVALDQGHPLRPAIARAMVLERIDDIAFFPVSSARPSKLTTSEGNDRVAPSYTEFIASRRGVYGASKRRP